MIIPTDEQLCQIAIEAKNHAYAPYSNFRVGAALLCKDGTVYTGCNVENASYGATICAERCAILKAISEGQRDFLKIAIISDSEKYTMPCGMCRQVMSEFMNDGTVLVESKGTIKSYKVSELIPESFEL